MQQKKMCTMTFAHDEHGKEILLKEGKFQVMMEWEKPYMEACIDALKPSGDVLEVGFGCGYASTHIQKYNPKSHTIIEFHPVVAQKAREFARRHPHVTIIEDTWQSALPHLGVFDTLFFDDYPLESEEEMQELEQKQGQSHALLRQGNQLLAEVDKQLPFLKEIVYSDAAIAECIDTLVLQPEVSGEQILRFLSDLAKGKQITASQMDQALKRLKEKGLCVEIPKRKAEEAGSSHTHLRGPCERLFIFLRAALNNHMRSGSRFSCFLSSAQSKFEDEKFFQEIILNPDLEYHEEKIQVEVPPNCNYYTDGEALVITITKKTSMHST